jgi:hypothetical protein
VCVLEYQKQTPAIEMSMEGAVLMQIAVTKVADDGMEDML